MNIKEVLNSPKKIKLFFNEDIIMQKIKKINSTYSENEKKKYKIDLFEEKINRISQLKDDYDKKEYFKLLNDLVKIKEWWKKKAYKNNFIKEDINELSNMCLIKINKG